MVSMPRNYHNLSSTGMTTPSPTTTTTTRTKTPSAVTLSKCNSQSTHTTVSARTTSTHYNNNSISNRFIGINNSTSNSSKRFDANGNNGNDSPVTNYNNNVRTNGVTMAINNNNNNNNNIINRKSNDYKKDSTLTGRPVGESCIDNGVENNVHCNNSGRSTGSASRSISTRKMHRSSFRRTLLHQKQNERKNNISNNVNNNGKINISVPGTFPRSDTQSAGTNNNKNNMSFTPSSPSSSLSLSTSLLKSNSVAAAIAAMEEREAGVGAGVSAPLPSRIKSSYRHQQQPPAIHTDSVETNSSCSNTNTNTNIHLSNSTGTNLVVSNNVESNTVTKQQQQQVIGRDGEEFLPQGHVDTILDTYGSSSSSLSLLDLYNDVLRVSPEASDREIRIAYFRRGREILGEAALPGSSSASSSNHNSNNENQNQNRCGVNKLDTETKTKFQAVSMAYEILTTPEWKKIYLRQGGLNMERRRKATKTNDDNDDGTRGSMIADLITKTATATATATSTTNSFISPFKSHRQQHSWSQNQPIGDSFSSSPSAVAAAFPTTANTRNTTGDSLVVPIVKKGNSIASNITFRSKNVQQQQHVIHKEFQKKSTPISTSTSTSTILPRLPLLGEVGVGEREIKVEQRLPTALRRSSFTGRIKARGKDADDKSDSTSSTKIKNKRISKITGTTTSSSVRWKDHVEELIFSNHPNEHAASRDDDDTDDNDYDDVDDETEDDDIVEEEERNHRRQTSDGIGWRNSPKEPPNYDGSFPRPEVGADATSISTASSYSVMKSPPESSSNLNRKRSNKKNKSKIVIDSEELESHLKQIDNEAEKHFVQDFWDNFEESMDGIMSLVDSMGDTSKSKGGSNQGREGTGTPFSASSWLSLSSSILSSSQQQQQQQQQQCENHNNNRSNNQTDVTTSSGTATISRSMSYDMISTNSIIYENEEEAVLKRSNTYPDDARFQPHTDPPSQPQQQTLVSHQQQEQSSLQAAKIVTPNHHEDSSSKRLDSSSSYQMILNSWPFQNTPQIQEQQQQQQQHGLLSTTISPAVVSPASQSARSTKPTLSSLFPESSSPHSVTVMSPSSEATTSIASDIVSQQQLQRKLFRPISPTLSEASNAITCEFGGGSSSSNNNNSALSSVNDKFDSESRISEMDSLDLTEFDNPFRQEPSISSTASPSSAPKSHDGSDTPRPASTGAMVDEENRSVTRTKFPPNATNHTSTTNTKKSKFRVTMRSRIRGSSYKKEQEPLSHDQVANKSGRTSRTSKADSTEDVFAGVDEGSQKQQQQCDMADSRRRPLNLQDISIERSASHMSDLSESVYTAKKKYDDQEEMTIPAIAPASEGATVTFAPSTISGSVLSLSTKKSTMMNSTARNSVRSEGSIGYSSYASTRDTNSVHSIESAAAESSGFYEYFIAYVTAIISECANLGTTNGKPAEYQQDFITLFSNDASVHAA